MALSKSQAIRDLLATNPHLTPREIIKHLAEKGIIVSTQKVHAADADGDEDELIGAVIALAERAGGIHKLKALVDGLSE